VIVRIRALGKDKYGDPVEGSPSRLQLSGCQVAPRTSSDTPGRGRDGVIVGQTLYGPFDLDLISTDVVEVDGIPYSIEGEVGKWENRRSGRQAGIEVALKRGTG